MLPHSELTRAGRLVPDKIYHQILEQHPDGAAILQELCEEYYYRSSFVANDACSTAFHEGQRSVIIALLDRISRGGQ